MRITSAKVGMEVVDKLTGIAYRIEATDEATNTTITKAEAIEIVDENEDREPGRITITDKIDQTFTTVKWVDDAELHKASVTNGILTVDGKDVEMGSIIAKEILKVFPGVVIFTANDSEVEDKTIVYQYSPSRDTMTKLGWIVENTTVIEDTDTRMVFAFSCTKEIEKKDGDKVETFTVFDRAGVYVLTKGMLNFTALEPYGDEDFDDYEQDESDIPEGFLGYDLKKAVIAVGGKYFYFPEICDNKKAVEYTVVRITNAASFDSIKEFPGYLTAVTKNRTVARNLGPAIFSGEGFVKIDNVIIRSNKLDGYIFLVGANRDRANDTNTYVLSDKDRNLITVIRKNTKDRGEIFTIQ